MRSHLLRTALLLAMTPFSRLAIAAPPAGADASPTPPAILIELFTSEGCSSCPPADELLRRVNGQRSHQGALLIGLSEHVSYWNGLGWQDPFSSELYTSRQSSYADRFGIAGPYTPQMIVNGRQEFVGSDVAALEDALARQSAAPHVNLHIDQVTPANTAGGLNVRFTAGALPPKVPLQLMVAIVDDADRSSVRRGENSGRSLQHVFVVRALMPVGLIHTGASQSIDFALPNSILSTGQKHHVILFAQAEHLGPIFGADLAPLQP